MRNCLRRSKLELRGSPKTTSYPIPEGLVRGGGSAWLRPLNPMVTTRRAGGRAGGASQGVQGAVAPPVRP
eukprot:3319492-Alexandrium_andersonii.AAC.1